MAAVGQPLEPGSTPVISNFPIWIAESLGVSALALPNEMPSDVLDLARTFGARLLVIAAADHGQWPAVLSTGAPDSECFQPLDLGPSGQDDPLGDIHVYEIACP
jgi:hypothetical protein